MSYSETIPCNDKSAIIDESVCVVGFYCLCGTKTSMNAINFLNSRVHAEYQINSHPDYPFWFTPAQFAGRLVTDYDCHHIYHFELTLPTDNQLNIGNLRNLRM